MRVGVGSVQRLLLLRSWRRWSWNLQAERKRANYPQGNVFSPRRRVYAISYYFSAFVSSSPLPPPPRARKFYPFSSYSSPSFAATAGRFEPEEDGTVVQPRLPLRVLSSPRTYLGEAVLERILHCGIDELVVTVSVSVCNSDTCIFAFRRLHSSTIDRSWIIFIFSFSAVYFL